MHVHTHTPLSPDQIRDRFDAASAGAGGRRLDYVDVRTPPKFFLRGLPVVPPAAAEVWVDEKGSGSEVVLRLMWGPLPAPFPRAVAGVGLLLAVLLLAFAPGTWVLAALCLALPLGALLYQREGEQSLQSRLSAPCFTSARASSRCSRA
jgi:hypothetical protein